ncbi:MAG: hypothetical protein GF329_01550 [Candidatus Lokiarchaeota archaeon]|nr:hypothetical protein [Candidatus Lokiarchaeota archaeon]
MKLNKIKSIIIGLCILLPLILIMVPINQANSYHGSILEGKKYYWKIVNVTSEVVDFNDESYQLIGKWNATSGQDVTFEITNVTASIKGELSIGNLTTESTDSNIANQLTLSVWPWFPGLISSTDWDSVKQAAIAAANYTQGNYMNGSMEITNDSSLITFKYIQNDTCGNQNTTLIYNMTTGVLIECNTEFLFMNDYHLALQFDHVEYEIEKDEIYRWEITNVTSSAVSFLNETYSEIGKWAASAGDILKFRITNTTGDIKGVLTIGNLTTEEKKSNIANQLTLSIWPWFPGLISSTNWETVKQSAESAANYAQGNYMNGSLEITNDSYFIKFKYIQNETCGNQNTTLIYEMFSGILIECYTEVNFTNHYYLGLEFDGISIYDVPDVPKRPIGIELLLFIIPAIAIIAIIYLHKKKISKKLNISF